MTRRTTNLTDRLYEYLLSVSLREPELFRRLRDQMAEHPYSICQIAPEQGQFMAFLVKLMGARRAIEVGVFTGYSSLWVASALPGDGQIVACDVSEEWTSIAREYWRQAGVAHKIDLRLGPALETLQQLVEAGESGRFDFAFIDADKPNYDAYYEHCLALIRVGGLIAVDNVFRLGRVIDPKVQDEGTAAVRALNEKLHADSRVDISLVPIGDGLTLARKRA